MPDDREAGASPHELLPAKEYAEELSGPDLQDLEDTLAPEDQDAKVRARRLHADGLLVERLRADGFAGPRYEKAMHQFMDYGQSVMMAWTGSGLIFKRSRQIGRPVPIEQITLDWSYEERGDISLDTVMDAENLFRREGLIKGRWCPEKGASLPTYFVGAAIRSFRPVYQRWFRERERMRAALREAARDQEADHLSLLDLVPDQRGSDGFDQADFWARFGRLNIPDPATRGGLYLYAQGYTQHEAAFKVGLTARALEGRIRRLRQQIDRDGKEGER